jgi:hypothetical protein
LTMSLHHLEWLIGDPVPDPEMVIYQVLPYAPLQADRVIEHLCGLAGLDVGQAGHDPKRAERVRVAFGLIVDTARVRQEMLDVEQFERGISKRWGGICSRDCATTAAGSPPGSATGAPTSRCAGRWALGDLGLAGRAGRRWLHHLRNNPVVRRRTIDRALEARLLQRHAGRSDRHDRVVLVQWVGRA